MSGRLGIELSPSACRIVDVDAPGRGRDARDTRVRSFAVLPPSGEETRTRLAALRRRSAAVVVWNMASEHRQVVVTGGTYEAMRREALAALGAAGLQTRGAAADIVPADGTLRRDVRQPVVVALASSAEMNAALSPLRAAGIRLRSVTTPAMALASLARRRRAFAVPGRIEAYIALERAVSCLALVRDLQLVAATTLAWGYEDGESHMERPRDEIASRLAEAVVDFVAAIGGSTRDISQVCISGALPDLRSMTLPLMEQLDVEVEPLDSLFSIDAARLPAPADRFRERVVELRLAWAAAADWPPPINLLRPQHRRTSRTVLTRAAVAAGVVAGLGTGWAVERTSWWQSTTASPAPAQPVSRSTTASGRARGGSAAGGEGVVGQQGTRGAATQGDRGTTAAPTSGLQRPPSDTPAARPIVPEPDVGPQLPVVARRGPAPAPLPEAAPARPPAAPEHAPARPAITAPTPAPGAEALAAGRAVEGIRQTPPLARLEPAPPARTEASRREEASPPRSASTLPAPARAANTPPVRAVTPAPSGAARPATEVPRPFDAVLGTILYSPDRKLAIVDGRIVGIGDQVRGARITDITPSTVLLRDAEGRLRALTLARGR
jgi:hypothetical protein